MTNWFRIPVRSTIMLGPVKRLEGVVAQSIIVSSTTNLIACAHTWSRVHSVSTNSSCVADVSNRSGCDSKSSIQSAPLSFVVLRLVKLLSHCF